MNKEARPKRFCLLFFIKSLFSASETRQHGHCKGHTEGDEQLSAGKRFCCKDCLQGWQVDACEQDECRQSNREEKERIFQAACFEKRLILAAALKDMDELTYDKGTKSARSCGLKGVCH